MSTFATTIWNMRRTLLATIAITTLTTTALVGCSDQYSNKYDYAEPEVDLQADDYGGPVPDYEPSPEELAPPEPMTWSCYYDETWNDDWHDDVLCVRGTERHRPYLLEYDDFIEYDEIMAAAAEYETYLNSQ